MAPSPGALFWRGLVSTAIGLVALVWPGITIGAFVVLFAVYAFAAGAMNGLHAFSTHRVGSFVGWLLVGVLCFFSGVTALAWPGITAFGLTVWIGAWALANGIAEIGVTFRAAQNGGERAMWLLAGTVSLLLGFTLLLRPDLGAVSLATVFGLFALFHGVSGIIASFALESMKTHGPRAGL